MFLTKLYVRLSTMWNERGATAVEYGLMVALIAVAIVVIVGLIGVNLNRLFTIVNVALNGAPAVP